MPFHFCAYDEKRICILNTHAMTDSLLIGFAIVASHRVIVSPSPLISALFKNTNVEDVMSRRRQQREQAKEDAQKKKEQDKMQREKDKLSKQERKDREKKRTQKGERKR